MLYDLSGLYLFIGLLVGGIILTVVSKKLRAPDVIALVLLGVIVGQFSSIDLTAVIPIEILVAFSIFALILIIFQSSAKFKIKEVKELSPLAAKLSLTFLGLCIVFLTIATHFLFSFGEWGIKDFLASILFASLMGATAPSVALNLIQKTKNKLIEVLQFESIINTPLTVIIPFIIIELMQGTIKSNFVIFALQQVMTGIGTGLVISLVVFRFLYKEFSKEIAPLIIIGTVLATYALAEVIDGNGILAVTTLGLVYGRTHMEEKLFLGKFTEMFTELLKIVVFIILGLAIQFETQDNFLVKSFILLGIYLIIRYVAIKISFKKAKLRRGEIFFMSVNVPKGIAVTVVAFMLIGFGLPELSPVLNLVYLFVLYTIIISSFSAIFAYKFLDLQSPGLEKIKKKT